MTDGVVAAITIKVEENQSPGANHVISLTANISEISVLDCNGNDFTPANTNVRDATVHVAPFGDLNNTDAVDAGDCLRILRYTVGIEPLTQRELQIADVAPEHGTPPDAIVDINDANACGQAVLGLITLPVGLQKLQFVPSGKGEVILSTHGMLRSPLGGVLGVLTFNIRSVEIESIEGVSGFTVIASKIDSEAGIAKFLAGSTVVNGLLSGDLLRVHYRAKGSSDPAFGLSLRTYSTDSRELRLSSESFGFRASTSLVTFGLTKLELSQTVLRHGSLEFRVEGYGIAGFDVEIFNLSGRRVFSRETSGTTLRFAGLANDGRRLANGVYLYIVTVRGINGEALRSEVRKLVILQ